MSRRSLRVAARAGRAAPPVALLLVAGCGPGDPDSTPASGPTADRPASRAPLGGGALVRALACAACHPGVPAADAPAGAPPLGPDAGHDPAFLFTYLLEPGGARASGREGASGRGRRMPSFHLSAGESLALALYLTEGVGGAAGGTPATGDPRATRGSRASAEDRRRYRRALDANPGVDAEVGGRIFRALNCAGCHRHPDAAGWRNGPDLGEEWRRARPEWLTAWLRAPTAVRPFGYRPGTGGRMPDFALAPAEADSIAAFLLAGRADGTPGADDLRPGRERREDPGAAPTSSAGLAAHAREKAERLLRDRLPCLGCHRLGEDGGRIAPSLSTVARRRPPRYLRAIVAAPGEAAPGTIMPPVAVREGTRRLVTAFLLERGAGPVEADPSPADPGRGYLSLTEHVPRPPTAGEVEGRSEESSGREAYARRCAACHGVEGRAEGFNARYLPVIPTPHASAVHMSERPSSTLFDGVHAGGRILGKSHRMPPFGGSLSRERVWDLVAHMRELCACRGPDWSVDNREAPARVEPPVPSADEPPGAAADEPPERPAP